LDRPTCHIEGDSVSAKAIVFNKAEPTPDSAKQLPATPQTAGKQER
jgi:hypothetical protein